MSQHRAQAYVERKMRRTHRCTRSFDEVMVTTLYHVQLASMGAQMPDIVCLRVLQGLGAVRLSHEQELRNSKRKALTPKRACLGGPGRRPPNRELVSGHKPHVLAGDSEFWVCCPWPETSTFDYPGWRGLVRVSKFSVA